MIPSKKLKKSDEYTSDEAIAAAKRVLDERGEYIHHGEEVETQFVELGLYDSGERLAALEQALDELTAQCRLGPRPPSDFSVGAYHGNRMYAFLWNSTEYGGVYVKFSLTGADKLACLVLHSFHKQIPKGS